MAESCKDYLTTYVLDTDIVPRMSFESMEHLRDDILECVARIKVTKHQASRAKRDIGEVDRLLHRKGSIPPSKFVEQLDEFRSHLAKRKSEQTLLSIPLYPPGKIVQLVHTGEDTPSGCFSRCSAEVLQERVLYAARWAQREDFGEVIISSHFMDDHSSPNVLNELERVAELFDLTPPFTIAVDQSES